MRKSNPIKPKQRKRRHLVPCNFLFSSNKLDDYLIRCFLMGNMFICNVFSFWIDIIARFYVFFTNEADVLREMCAFLETVSWVTALEQCTSAKWAMLYCGARWLNGISTGNINNIESRRIPVMNTTPAFIHLESITRVSHADESRNTCTQRSASRNRAGRVCFVEFWWFL